MAQGVRRDEEADVTKKLASHESASNASKAKNPMNSHEETLLEGMKADKCVINNVSKSRDVLDNPQKDFELELNGIDAELAKFDNEKTEQGQNQKPLPCVYKNLNTSQLS